MPNKELQRAARSRETIRYLKEMIEKLDDRTSELQQENERLKGKLKEAEMIPGFLDGLKKLDTLKHTATERDEFKLENRRLKRLLDEVMKIAGHHVGVRLQEEWDARRKV